MLQRTRPRPPVLTMKTVDWVEGLKKRITGWGRGTHHRERALKDDCAGRRNEGVGTARCPATRERRAPIVLRGHGGDIPPRRKRSRKTARFIAHWRMTK